MMNPEIKQKWVSALRSGKYKQTQAMLRGLAFDGFCCLGVLCDIHANETGEKWKGNLYLGAGGFLPFQVREWAGLTMENPLIPSIGFGDFGRSLSSYNDSGTNFSDIADLIEKNL